MRNDLNIDEIFIPYSFEEWNMKHMDTKKNIYTKSFIEYIRF